MARPLVAWLLLAAALVLSGPGGADAHVRPLVAPEDAGAVLTREATTGPEIGSGASDPAAMPAVAALPLPPATDGGSGSAAALWLAALVVLAAGAGARRWRRVASPVLAVLLGVLLFETAVHSVHHLGDAQDASCLVASATAHMSGTLDEPTACAPARDRSVAGVLAAAPDAARSIPWQPRPIRGPPRLPA
jgi:hypothetical protein